MPNRRRDPTDPPIEQGSSGANKSGTPALIVKIEVFDLKNRECLCSDSAPEAEVRIAQVEPAKNLALDTTSGAIEAQRSADVVGHAQSVSDGDLNPQLATLLAFWPALSPHVREAVVTLIDADVRLRQEGQQ